MRSLLALPVLALLLLAAVPTQGNWVHAPQLPWADTLDAAQPCAPLQVGVGARTITPVGPDGKLWHEPYDDANGNGYYDAPDPLDPTAPFDPYTDANLNGKWDGPFMAGYGHDPPEGPNAYYTASSVHDPVWARALAVRCGSLTLGLVSLDTVGLFLDEVQRIRAAAAGYDHVVVASTHTHGSVDTMGLWGPNFLTDGKDPRTMEHVRTQTGLALADALAGLQPVKARFAATRAPNDFSPGGLGFGALQTDLRDPVVIDDALLAAQFVGLDGATVATLVNWSPHPETMCGAVGEITSDFAHYLREGVERGGFVVAGEPQQGLGGTAVYFSGAVGGMMTTLRAKVRDEAGQVLPQCSYAKTQRIGELAAWAALRAVRAAPFEDVPALRVQVREVDVPVDNVFLIALDALGIFDRSAALGPVRSEPLGPLGNVVPLPYLRTEVGVVTLGAGPRPLAQLATVPGELLPEVALGGGLQPLDIADPAECWRHNPLKQHTLGGAGRERFVAANPGIPAEPSFLQHMPARHRFLLGLANDELGYIVPANDFVPPTVVPALEQGHDRCGDDDHYEETVSASSILAPIVAQNLTMLLDPSYQPPAEPVVPAGLRMHGDGLPAGAWVDTSGSGGFEAQEDTHVYLGRPGALPTRFGFLDAHGRDAGSDPAALAGRDLRGLWVDTNGSGRYEPGVDGAVFADAWLLGDDAVAEAWP